MPARGHIRGEKSLRFPSSAAVLRKRPYFNRYRDGARQFSSPCDGGVEVGRLQDRKSTNLFLAFDEGPVGNHDLTVLMPQQRGGTGRMEAAAEQPNPRSLHFFSHGDHVAHDPFQLIGRRLGASSWIANAEQVILHGQIPHWPATGRLSASKRTASSEFDN